VNALAELLDRLVEPERPGDPAIVQPNGRVAWTRGALAERVRACAGAFVRAGLEPGTPVAFGVRQDADGIPWLLGALRAGVVVVVLDPGLTPGSLVDRCRVAGVRATVTDGLVGTIASNAVLRGIAERRGICIPDLRTLAAERWSTSRVPGAAGRLDPRDGGDGNRPLAPNARALVMFTSGTTGAPRGVVHSPSGIAAMLDAGRRLVELRRDDRVLGSGLHLVGPALVAGAAVVLPPSGDDPRALARVTRQVGVTRLSLPLHRAIAWEAAGGMSVALRTLLLGSAPVRNRALRKLVECLPEIDIRSVYGLTEYPTGATVSAVERLAHDERDGDLVGRPLEGVEIRVAADGELHVAGPALALGYLGGPAAISEVATGDLGRLDGTGRVVLLGRRKEMLIRNGENIYPPLYESTLADAADLETAIMVGVPSADGDETVVLFAVPHRGGDVAIARKRLEAVVAGTSSPLDRHARPDAVLAIAEVPRSGRSGKPDRLALTRIAAAQLGRTIVEDSALPAPS
jgi:acyl-CoA synthetase (AMP-forming)/AMP-acid ligase II